ncbi:ABC transporter substrate-binding protein [Natrialbaceae archaeon A-arb3/5]
MTSRDRKEPIQELDGVLPSGIDRRKFLQTTAAAVAAVGAAGCTGGNGEEGEITWRQPWVVEPTWAFAYVAEDEGYWDDKDISPPEVQSGDGSPDTARRVGTNENTVGTAEVTSVIGGWAEGQESLVFGATKQWSLLAVMWPSDGDVEDETDLEGHHVILSSPFAEDTWPIIPDAFDLDPDEISTEFADEDIAPALASDADAVYGSIDTVLSLERGLEEEGREGGMELYPINNHYDVIGNPLLVSREWYEDEDDADDILTGILEGYSEAVKWVSLNPDEAIDILEEREPEVGAQERDELEDQMVWGITLTTGGGAHEEGLGYLDDAAMADSIELLADAATDNPDDVPDPDDVILTEPTENADLATFDDDEWAEVEEYISHRLEVFDAE